MAGIELNELPLRPATAGSGATTVTYNGNVIEALDDGTATLLTQNKFCMGNITIDTDSTVSFLEVLYGSYAIISTSGAHSYQLLTGGKYLNNDIVITCYTGTGGYMTFSSPTAFSISVANSTKNWDGTIEYSTDETNWTTWDGTSTISAVADSGTYYLYLKGSGNTVITGGGASDAAAQAKSWIVSGSNVTVTGLMEDLRNSSRDTTMGSSCYEYLFYNNPSIITAPYLTGQSLTSKCFKGMFQGCTNLTATPALSWTSLASDCYNAMFQGCTSLTSTPTLPATSLASQCYMSMFKGCTSLVTVTSLPATTLATGCYSNMFQDCTSLVNPPNMLFTTVASYSCYYMFDGCTSLNKLYKLMPTTLQPYCYANMYSGCTSIVLSATRTSTYNEGYRVPFADIGTTATGALDNMFTGTGGTFTGTPVINTSYFTNTTLITIYPTPLYELTGTTTFDGTSTYFDTGLTIMDKDKDFTVFISFKADIITGTQRTILHSQIETNPWPGFCIDIQNSNFRYNYFGPTSKKGDTKNIHKIVITHTAGDLRTCTWYLDSTVATSWTGTRTYTNNTKSLLIGCYRDDSLNLGRYFQGTIYGVKVYDAVLSAAEISELIT